MSRSLDIARTLAATALLAGGVAWLIARPHSSRETIAAEPPADSPPAESPAGNLELPVHSVAEPERRAVQIADGASPAVAPERTGWRARVLVHGQVRRSGQLVADYDLTFQPVGAGVDESDDDWDTTDEEGRFEVELRAESRYVVLNEDEGPWVTEFVVPAGRREFPLDIDLARGN